MLLLTVNIIVKVLGYSKHLKTGILYKTTGLPTVGQIRSNQKGLLEVFDFKLLLVLWQTLARLSSPLPHWRFAPVAYE